ncbi:PHD finger protein 7-like [Cyrtonyx montezumae]|uniref:PHD finger protein 7-like n=1 Tax=Cyrtonyx montezumae TaxID=9017 RepID=UPI0032DADC0D
MSTGTEKNESSWEPDEKCALCAQGDVDPDIHGHKVILNGWILHEFCVVFSTILVEQATAENINKVSSVPDITYIIWKAEKTHCFVCGKRGASITCAQAGCDRSFHLPCASEGECVTQYFDEFRSFCREHRPLQETEGEAVPAPDNTCIICTDPVGDCVSYSTMVCPVCERAFHRACIQGQAMNAGIFFFSCPHCRDLQCFSATMRWMGIRIPTRYPTWDEEYGYESEPESHSRCDASECRYPRGREQAETVGPWELLICSSCAARGTHRRCSHLSRSTATWVCDTCAGEGTASSSHLDSAGPSTASTQGLGPTQRSSQGSEAPELSTSSTSSWAPSEPAHSSNAPQSSAPDFASQGTPRSSRPSRAAGNNVRSRRGERAQTRSRYPLRCHTPDSPSRPRTRRGSGRRATTPSAKSGTHSCTQRGALCSSRDSTVAYRSRRTQPGWARTRSHSPLEQRADESRSRIRRGCRSQFRQRGPDQGRSRSQLPRQAHNNSRPQRQRRN